MRELLDKGSLGALTVLESRFERFRPEHGPHAAGGGTLPDFGSHLADQALVLAGPVTGVYAEVHHRADPGGLDDDVFAALTHDRGVRSHLWGSWRQGAPARGSAPPEPRPPTSSRTSTARKPSYAAGRRRRQKASSGASSRRNGGATSGVARPPSPCHRPAAHGTCSTRRSPPRSAAPSRRRWTCREPRPATAAASVGHSAKARGRAPGWMI